MPSANPLSTRPGDLVDRFFHVLLEEIRSRKPEYLDAPFTLAEIYQDLVPYRTHRDAIGVEMNGDYEDALLRLLAGHGEYLVVDSERAVKEIREELDEANPNTGLYREFAAVDVRLNPERLPEDAGSASGPAIFTLDLPEGDEAGKSEATSSGVEGVATPSTGASSAAPPSSGKKGRARAPKEEPPGGTEAATGSDCAWCGRGLPARDDLRFCPFCGGDTGLVPCVNCGAELDREWLYCVACGEATGKSA